MENPEPEDRSVRGAARHAHHRLRAARAAHAPVHAQEQMAGERLQVQLLGHQHRAHRIRRDGAALHHAGADLVPLGAVPVDLDAVPHRSVHLPFLDLHHRHRVPVRARPVLRLGLPVRLAVRGAVQDCQHRGPEALSVPVAAGLA
ncbi:hypothetical protein SDC9_132761 [bioreactor metagenome]|uniref:Uncharacterized protein n=1 Tax=bioreactor metagenome TaxID=1076179 RepID=A0A645D832_9ZZZZ